MTFQSSQQHPNALDLGRAQSSTSSRLLENCGNCGDLYGFLQVHNVKAGATVQAELGLRPDVTSLPFLVPYPSPQSQGRLQLYEQFPFEMALAWQSVQGSLQAPAWSSGQLVKGGSRPL